MFLFHGNNRRTNIDAGGGYCVITVFWVFTMWHKVTNKITPKLMVSYNHKYSSHGEFTLPRPQLNRELKQPRRRRQQNPHKFAYLTIENSIFARFARAYFIFWHFEDVLVLSTTWNDLFCSCVDDVSIWWEMFNFVFLCPKRLFQFNSRTVRTHFSSIATSNN